LSIFKKCEFVAIPVFFVFHKLHYSI
jgi:hypothetical protein